MEAAFRSAWPMSFRRPGVFEARVHGPGAASETLAYPMPSTIAGALASLAYEAGACSRAQRPGVYGDTEACLESLFGEKYHLYTGLARHSGKLYVYTSRGYAPLDTVKKLLASVAPLSGRPRLLFEGLMEGLKAGSSLQARVLRRTGIALNRSSKTAAPGMLYTIGMLDPLQGTELVEFVALVEASKSPIEEGEKRFMTTLGGEQRPAQLVLRSSDTEPVGLLSACSGNNTLLLLLVSPALLDESPWAGVIELTKSAAKRLAESLVSAAGLESILEPREPYIVQLTREPVEAVMPGWSMAREVHRPPLLLVPAGTIVVATTREDPCRAAKEAARRGLGAYTRLGWGTVVVA
ncbi:hypothetical protein Pdsh_06585 [Pyrodictium delaneyi]|uniref:Uncharacterized protein n=1 Tax=Pyrodictium delaneyi TaxID=1273541 RepID=A0A211YNE6_9CREN|nr:hypothetical protein Pdsh_06800 [Pyrodictium delaneyi]OWJ54679.1 hypothetical protein Pdsh_06585 [Pyrodictium delaneyi]